MEKSSKAFGLVVKLSKAPFRSDLVQLVGYKRTLH